MSDGPIFVAGPDDAASGPDALKLRAAESLSSMVLQGHHLHLRNQEMELLMPVARLFR